MKIDIDLESAAKPISKREKIAIWILLLIYGMIMPAKYDHQAQKLTDKIETLLNE